MLRVSEFLWIDHKIEKGSGLFTIYFLYCILCPVDWEEWSDWAPCSSATTCGPGSQTKNRLCKHNGTPGVDRMCMGPLTGTKTCIEPGCAGKVSTLQKTFTNDITTHMDSVQSKMALCGFFQQNSILIQLSFSKMSRSNATAFWIATENVYIVAIESFMRWGTPNSKCQKSSFFRHIFQTFHTLCLAKILLETKILLEKK